MLNNRVQTILLTIVAIIMIVFTLGRSTDQITDTELYICSWLGSGECQGWLGNRKDKQEDYEVAEHWYLKAADQSSSAQIALGSLYYRGNGTEPTPSKAFYWYDRAIKSGRRDATLLLTYGQMLVGGVGTNQDMITGLEWVTKSAFLRNKHAQLALVRYYNSDDEAAQKILPQDGSLAFAWLKMARGGVPENTELYQAIKEESDRLLETITFEESQESEIDLQLIKQNMLRRRMDLPQEK